MCLLLRVKFTMQYELTGEFQRKKNRQVSVLFLVSCQSLRTLICFFRLGNTSSHFIQEVTIKQLVYVSIGSNYSKSIFQPIEAFIYPVFLRVFLINFQHFYVSKINISSEMENWNSSEDLSGWVSKNYEDLIF